MLLTYVYIIVTVMSTVTLSLAMLFLIIGGYFEVKKRISVNSEVMATSENVNMITFCMFILVMGSLAATYAIKFFLL